MTLNERIENAQQGFTYAYRKQCGLPADVNCWPWVARDAYRALDKELGKLGKKARANAWASLWVLANCLDELRHEMQREENK